MSKRRTFIPPHFRPRVKGENINPQVPYEKSSLKVSSKKTEKKSVVCITVKDDSSQTRVMQKYVTDKEIIYLYFDDIGIGWNFSYHDNSLTFHTQNETIVPLGIYCRPFCPAIGHSQYDLCNYFSIALNCWKGPKITAGMEHFHNSSKAFQMTTTIRHAIESLNNHSFNFPSSYFVKGEKLFDKVLKKEKSLIVKSCSGIRSEVTTDSTFKKWEKKNLENLPTLFQKACFGYDIRVHFLNGHCWQIILKEKEGGIDYRYAKKKGAFEKMKWNEEMKKFCESMVKFEKLWMAGVDFIKVGKKFYCLECNPNPGWAGFHRACGQEPEIAQTIGKRLYSE